MKTCLRTFLPVMLLLVGVVAAWALAQGRPVPTTDAGEPAAPLVRVMPLEPGPVQLSVRAHGTVEPRTESDLVPEVSGRVVWLSSALAAGGFFEAGDLLLEIDRGDYENAVRRARAQLARAESEVRLARAELERSSALAERNVTSASKLDKQRNAEQVALAGREESRSALEQALRDLERTRLRAPFAGRVRRKSVDVGQFVARGTPVARLYAVDFAELRLPIHDADLAHLDVPIGYRGGDDAAAGPSVILRGRFAGRSHEWHGRIVRTEGEIDAQSRMVHLVARVEDPYGRHDGRPPLSVGLFVEAEIRGRTLEDVLDVPRAAVREGDRILVVDAEDRLRRRNVEVLRLEGERALIRAAVASGERLCLSDVAGLPDGAVVAELRDAEVPR
jgi:RND family efflux transporter MFP subunit